MANRQDRVGSLDRRITIEKYTASRGPSGEELLNWETLAQMWANVTYMQGGSGEKEDAKRETSTNRVVIMIRYRKDLDPAINAKMRVLYEGKILDILNISEKTELGRKSYLDLVCEQKETTDAS